MKKIILLIPFFAMLPGIYCQDWQLFPYNQRSYFSYDEETLIYEKDSVRNPGDTLFFYFNSDKNYPECLDNEVSTTNNNNDVYFSVDSGYITGNYVYYYTNTDELEQFRFKLDAKPGESWNLNVFLKFRCDSASTGSFLGITDSLKYFSIYSVLPLTLFDEIPLVLSKNYGLTEFAMLGELLDNPTDTEKIVLSGFEKENEKAGITMPRFEDFFHLRPGDMIYWHYFSESADINLPDQEFYYRDSITRATRSPDSVSYEISRIYDADNRESIYYTFRRKDFAPFISANTHESVFASGVPFNYNSAGPGVLLQWTPAEFNLGESYSAIHYLHSGLIVDTQECYTDIIFDSGYDFILDTRLGISSYCTLGIGNTCTKAVGAVIDGEVWGDINIPIDLEEKVQVDLIVYPNPFTDKIFIKCTGYKTLHYMIIDMNGKLVLEGLYEGYINAETLQRGLYTLMIYNNDVSVTRNVVKVSWY